MPRLLWPAWLALLLLTACSMPAAPTPVETRAGAAAGLPAVTVYKSPT
ncbi:MAG: hypothetical protein IT329_10390 [Caldilineaceae bacterium]|nr:hypothetical protein [Caldilineaceae bacterium]